MEKEFKTLRDKIKLETIILYKIHYDKQTIECMKCGMLLTLGEPNGLNRHAESHDKNHIIGFIK